MVIVFRYELNGEIHERFWGFFNPENVKADGLSKCVIILKDKSTKFVAQTFDDAKKKKFESNEEVITATDAYFADLEKTYF